MAHTAQPGEVVAGRYRLTRSLRTGGFGRVWEAHDQRLHTDVAVKELRIPQQIAETQHGEWRKRAEREARNGAKLRDEPHIVTVHDAVTHMDAQWIIMQLIDGCSLQEKIDASGPLSADDAAKVAEAMLKALRAAHGLGIVHRDIKPANIMMASDGNILLTDFGIAASGADTRLTEVGTFIGTPEYISPEQIRGNTGTAASDLYSLGVTLYHAVEGFSPFKRDGNHYGTIHAVVNDAAPAARRAGRLAPLISGLMAKDSAQRPTLAEAMSTLTASRPQVPRTRTMPVAPRPRSKPTVLPPLSAADLLLRFGTAKPEPPRRPRPPRPPKPAPGSPRPVPMMFPPLSAGELSIRGRPPKSVPPPSPPVNDGTRRWIIATAVVIGLFLLYGNSSPFADWVSDGMSGELSGAEIGDCVYYDDNTGNDRAGHWVRVPCWSAATKYTVLHRVGAEAAPGACDGFPDWAEDPNREEVWFEDSGDAGFLCVVAQDATGE